MRLILLPDATAERELGAVAHLAQRAATCALVIAGLRGDAAALGRFQARGRSGAARELRRLSAGRSTHYGDGLVSLSALMPDPNAWLDERAPLTGPRFLNRIVRGLLAGLSKLGCAASYPGRDFVATDGGRVAYVSLAREPHGATLFHAILAVERAYTSAEPEPDWPGLPRPPEPTWLTRRGASARDFSRTAQALAAGFAERLGLAFDDSPLSADEERAFAAARPPALADGALSGLVSSGPSATPIGKFESRVALDDAGRLARVRLQGDFIAAESEREVLESALVGIAPDAPRVRELCAAWLARPDALVVGLTDAAVLADSIARAARAYSLGSSSST